MADIFVSYSQVDRQRVAPIVRALEALGCTVWWDPEGAAGVMLDELIDQEIAVAKCVVVVWSQTSVRSDWVLGEADEGRERGILAPVTIDGTLPPRRFRQLNTVSLADWRGDENAVEFQTVVAGVTRIAGHPRPLSSAECAEPDGSGRNSLSDSTDSAGGSDAPRQESAAANGPASPFAAEIAQRLEAEHGTFANDRVPARSSVVAGRARRHHLPTWWYAPVFTVEQIVAAPGEMLRWTGASLAGFAVSLAWFWLTKHETVLRLVSPDYEYEMGGPLLTVARWIFHPMTWAVFGGGVTVAQIVLFWSSFQRRVVVLLLVPAIWLAGAVISYFTFESLCWSPDPLPYVSYCYFTRFATCLPATALISVLWLLWHQPRLRPGGPIVWASVWPWILSFCVSLGVWRIFDAELSFEYSSAYGLFASVAGLLLWIVAFGAIVVSSGKSR